jgi:tetratricopeptide (TPR) repeat protein
MMDSMSPAGRLIGREPALAAAGSMLGDALSGSGQFLMISGEAGIGKTAMLAALIERAGPVPLVLRGFCWEGDGTPPYWPWSQVLRASGLALAELGEAGWLLQPASGTAEPMSAAAAADAQFRLFEAVSRCLTGLAARRPVLVVLDDLHWADEPSLRLLGFLARALAAHAVLLLGAYRDTEASRELAQLAGTAQQLALHGLGPAEVEAMARELAEAMAVPGPSSQVASELCRRSGGNPFLVRELTRLLVAQGSWHEPTQLPASVTETLRRRLARLSTDCVRLLERAAVAGRDIDLGLLAPGAAAGDATAQEDAARVLLDEARRAGVIAGTSEARFTHDLYRETILDGLAAPARAEINLSVGRALQARPGPAARVAAHLLAAGPQAQPDALDYCLLAAREATARLGHDDACAHYLRALQLTEAADGSVAKRTEILRELGASCARAGRPDQARQRFFEAAGISRAAGDAVGLALAALGVHALGHRSGARNAELLGLLREASHQLEAAHGPLGLRSRVQATLARVIRHGSDSLPGPEVAETARRAVDLATEADDASALATAKLALHDVMWRPGTAAARLPVIAEMLAAAEACGDDDLVAEAHLLRAAALLELGDPAGRDELHTYITLAGRLGHARGRWGALTRKATLAQLAGRAEEAARLGEQALELGLAIGEQDAVGCFCTSRGAMMALGVSEPPMFMGDPDDPLWPMYPVFQAWAPAVRGQAAEAAAALGDFSVLDVSMWTGLEGIAAAAVVFAAAGSDAQRTWAYEQLRPHAGTHVIIGGCASYHAAVDHHLGALAVSLGDTAAAEAHFRAALAMHERLGAAGWARLSEQALAGLQATPPSPPANEFRRADGVRTLCFGSRQVQVPDSKGLGDLAVLIGARGADVHVLTLVGHELPRLGADPVLDEQAKAAYKSRLDDLAVQIDDAGAAGRAEAAEKLRSERDALIRELAAAAGLGGRDRRLGDETERARKTVSARVRDALSKIDRVHPELAAHLRGAVRMGTVCSYAPAEPTTWQVS